MSILNCPSIINQLIKQLDDVEDKMNVQLQEELDKRRQERGKFNVKNVAGAVKEFIPGASIFSAAKGIFGEEDLSDEEQDEVLREHYNEKIIEKKKDIISNCVIPTSKEDVLEFLSISVFNSNNKINEATGLAKAWKEKSQQIINRAKQSFVSDSSVLSEIETYNKELNSVKASVISGFRKFFNS